MRVDSVNAGRSELMQIGARTVSTGIRKLPVERAYAGTLGLAGDVVADEENHGGLDQAIYLYSSEDYAWWAAELGGRPEPGTFGENLTLSSTAHIDSATRRCHTGSTTTTSAGHTAHSETGLRSAAFTTSVGRTPSSWRKMSIRGSGRSSCEDP